MAVMDSKGWNEIWSDEGHDHHHHSHEQHGEHAGHRHGHAGPDGLLPATVKGLAAGRALELGCGLGQNAVWLAQHGWQVRALDFSDVAIERAKHRAAELGVEVDFVVGDVTEGIPAGSYDLVTLFYVHLPPADRKLMLQRAAAAVAPGGRLLFVGHDRSDSEWFERHVRDGRHGRDHEGPSGEDLAATLTDPTEIAAELAGLTVERAEVVRHDPHNAGEQVGTTLVLARRRATP